MAGARIVFGTDTSGHTMGYHVVARGLRDGGFEVVMTGRQLPAELARSAVDEDADLVAYRIMDRDPVAIVQSLVAALAEQGAPAIPVLVGGIVSPAAAESLRAKGVVGVFGPGSRLADIVACARAATERE